MVWVVGWASKKELANFFTDKLNIEQGLTIEDLRKIPKFENSQSIVIQWSYDSHSVVTRQ